MPIPSSTASPSLTVSFSHSPTAAAAADSMDIWAAL
jgi:hypothetical protein